MTVWLIVFLLANGEQAETSSLWRPSKYECERLRSTLASDAEARGWVTRCLAWDIPGDFSVAPSSGPGLAEAEGVSGGDAQVLRQLRELKQTADSLDSSLDEVGSTTKNTQLSLRELERSFNRIEAALQSLRSRPCFR